MHLVNTFIAIAVIASPISQAPFVCRHEPTWGLFGINGYEDNGFCCNGSEPLGGRMIIGFYLQVLPEPLTFYTSVVTTHLLQVKQHLAATPMVTNAKTLSKGYHCSGL
jgi:hypothetical protein